MNQTARALASSLALIALTSAGCTGTTATTYSYYDPYAYYGYYPADVYYSSYYWTDPYDVYYYDTVGAAMNTVVSHDAGTSDAGGITGISGTHGIGDAIRALALGQEICPGQVTVTPKTGPNLCAATGAPDTVRNGVTIQFSGCTLSDGGQLDGTYDVQATRTASDSACDANTTITLSVTTTVTNLSYLGPGGRKVVIPQETGSSTLSYAIGQPPTSSELTLDGQMQVVGVSGVVLLDNTFSGTTTVTPQDHTAYSLDGTLTLQDQLVSATTTVTTQGLTRTTDCCRPTAGTLTVTRTGANNAGTHTWSFGPACGAAVFDNSGVTLPTTCL